LEHLHPESLMDQPMMRPAQKDKAGERGWSSVGPVSNVVGFAPPVRTVAPREPAAAIPDYHRPAHGSRHHGSAAAHFERLGSSNGDDPGDRGIAGPPPGGLGGDGACIAQLAPEAGTSLERLQVHGDGDAGALTRYERPVRRIQPPPADLTQGIGPSLGKGPAVGPRLTLFGIEHASERGDQDLAGLGVEVAVHPHHALEGGGDVETPKLERMIGILLRPR